MANTTLPLKVLIAKDNLLDFDVLQAALKNNFECQVALAVSLQEFEFELQNNRPNIILADSDMRSFDGIAVLKIAVQACPDVPFAFYGVICPRQSDMILAGKEVPWFDKKAGIIPLISFIKTISSTRPHSREKDFPPLGEYVRLNLTGEIVKLESYDPFRVWILYRGQKVELKRHEITPLTTEQEQRGEAG